MSHRSYDSFVLVTHSHVYPLNLDISVFNAFMYYITHLDTQYVYHFEVHYLFDAVWYSSNYANHCSSLNEYVL